jgi:hypothetical protein
VLHDKEQGQAALEQVARIRRKEQGHWIVTPDYCLGQVCKRVLRYKAGPQLAWLARVKMAREQAAVRQGEMDIGG